MPPTRSAEALRGFHRWALQRQAQQLDKHLRAGGAIVLARLLGEHEEQTVSGSLLRRQLETTFAVLVGVVQQLLLRDAID